MSKTSASFSHLEKMADLKKKLKKRDNDFARTHQVVLGEKFENWVSFSILKISAILDSKILEKYDLEMNN